MFCSDCGFKNSQDANFCGNCGKPNAEEEPYRMNAPDYFCLFCVLGGVGYALTKIVFLEFRTVYEEALYYEYFYQIEPYLLPGSNADSEFTDYFAEISGEVMIDNAVTEVIIYDQYALVSTYETFNFRNKAGNEKYYVKEKNYEVVIHTDGTYRIRNVNNR